MFPIQCPPPQPRPRPLLPRSRPLLVTLPTSSGRTNAARDTVTATEPSAVRARPFRARRSRNATGARVPATGAAARARESEPTCQGTCRLSDRPGRGAGSTDEEPEDRRDRRAEAGSDGDRLPPAGLPPAGSWRDSARTPEVLGRIWIAPYVDTAGVYHESSWVRVVIEPAGWRQAR